MTWMIPGLTALPPISAMLPIEGIGGMDTLGGAGILISGMQGPTVVTLPAELGHLRGGTL
jgi:hypothetical protein